MGKLQFRLATSRLANTFGNGTVYRHDKKIEKGEKPRNEPNEPSAEGASELRSAKGTISSGSGAPGAKDFAKV